MHNLKKQTEWIKFKDDIQHYLDAIGYRPSEIARLIFKQYPAELDGANFNGLRRHIERGRTSGIYTTQSLVETRIERNKAGEVVKTTESLRSGLNVDVSGMKIKKVTQLYHGGQNVTLMPDQNSLLISELSSVFEETCRELMGTQKKQLKVNKKATDKACIVTMTDEHVGMAIDKDSLFSYEYNADAYTNSMGKVFEAVMKEFRTHGTFDVLYIDNLGDGQDGWDKKTTRGGHELTQNMSNSEVFKTCLLTKWDLLENLIDKGVARKVVFRTVSNANHSSEFEKSIAIALQTLVNTVYDNEIAEVDILTKFIEARYYGDHGFLLTHGKDEKFMKAPLPYTLNDRTIVLISDVIDHYKIDAPYLHVHKGDLHCIGYDARPMKFDYRNFGAFSPPSNYIGHNFGNSKSSFAIDIVDKGSSEVAHTDYYLHYKPILI